jgi:hypothetical protein
MAVLYIPVPATFPLFATGLGVLGLLGWRRKRKGATSEKTRVSTQISPGFHRGFFICGTMLRGR